MEISNWFGMDVLEDVKQSIEKFKDSTSWQKSRQDHREQGRFWRKLAPDSMLKKQVKHCCELGLDAISIFGNAAEEVEQNHNNETWLDYTWPAVPLGNQTKLDSSCGFLALAGQAGFIQTENNKVDLFFDD